MKTNIIIKLLLGLAISFTLTSNVLSEDSKINNIMCKVHKE